MIRRAAAAACLLLLAGSADAATRRQPKPGDKPQAAPAWEKTFPVGVTFVLREMNGKMVPRTSDATLLIDSAYRGHGAAGCNNWTATVWPVRGQRLVAGGFSLTRKTCPGAAVAFQNAYLSVLGAGATWDMVNDDLVVKSPRGVLKFQRGL